MWEVFCRFNSINVNQRAYLILNVAIHFFCHKAEFIFQKAGNLWNIQEAQECLSIFSLEKHVYIICCYCQIYNALIEPSQTSCSLGTNTFYTILRRFSLSGRSKCMITFKFWYVVIFSLIPSQVQRWVMSQHSFQYISRLKLKHVKNFSPVKRLTNTFSLSKILIILECLYCDDPMLFFLQIMRLCVIFRKMSVWEVSEGPM